MGGMISHDEAAQLLGAYALDAVERDEAAAIEWHLTSCPRCRDELRNHREVVGVLAYSGQEAPEGLWDRVAASLRPSEDATPDLSLRLLSSGAHAGAHSVGGPGGGPGGLGSSAVRRRPRAVAAMSLLAAAAVVVIALLGVEVGRLQNRTNHLSGEVSAMSGQPTMAEVRQALATPGAKRLALRPSGGGAADLDAVILPGGEGYLYDARLTPLSSERTYQLWGVVGDQRISYGVLGPTPSSVTAFRASEGVAALAVTAEVAGGVVVSDQKPVAVGFLS